MEQTVTLTNPATGEVTTRPMTRREKIRANRKARAEAYEKATPEQRAEMDRKRAAKRASSRKHRKVDTNSRSYRWAAAIGTATGVAQQISDLVGDFNTCMDELRGLQEEYQGWYDNLPEGLQQSSTGEKLQAIIDLDLEDAEDPTGDMQGKIDEAESVDLPLGFGRD